MLGGDFCNSVEHDGLLGDECFRQQTRRLRIECRLILIRSEQRPVEQEQPTQKHEKDGTEKPGQQPQTSAFFPSSAGCLAVRIHLTNISHTMPAIDGLITLLAERSARRGNFTLASGRQSTLYIDARLTTMSPEGLALIGPTALDALGQSGWDVSAVGGLTLGADPVSYAIAYASAGTTRPLRAFTVRKEAKAHGTGRLIEGPFNSGDRVAVIEDVITTGGSAIRAVESIRAAGGVVAGVLALVDREEGGREALEAEGLEVISLVRASQIVAQMSTS
jgi:orotate phosphoribosyltransferase